MNAMLNVAKKDESSLDRDHSVTQAVVSFVHALRWENLPTDVKHAGKRHFLDTVGTIIAGATTATTEQVEKALSSVRTEGVIPVPGRKRRADLLDAAYIAGCSGHGIELDDGYRQGSIHPGVAVIPALLPIAFERDVSGVNLLEAMVAGYEAMLAIARACHPTLRRRGFHPTATVGVFGSVAAAGHLRSLDTKSLSNAFGMAGSSAAGLFALLEGGADVKRLHAGHAAREGLNAVLFAEQGIEGPGTVLEAREGFMRAFAFGSGDLPDVQLPPRAEFATADCYVKPYACCRHLQPAAEALMQIISTERLKPNDITGVDVETYSIAAGHANTGWDDFASAQLSFPFILALSALYGEIRLDHFTDATRDAPAIKDFAKRVRITGSDELDRLYPQTRPARVTVSTRSGRFTKRAEEALGAPQLPLSDDQLGRKFEELAGSALGSVRARDLLDRLWDLDRVPNVAQLVSAMAKT